MTFRAGAELGGASSRRAYEGRPFLKSDIFRRLELQPPSRDERQINSKFQVQRSKELPPGRERICGFVRFGQPARASNGLNGFLILQLAVSEDLFGRRRAESARPACPSCDRITMLAPLHCSENQAAKPKAVAGASRDDQNRRALTR